MDDLISRADVLEIIKRTSGDYATAFCNVRDLPTINPEDLRPKGRWLWVQYIESDGHTYAECSNCHNVRIVDNFCSNCGAEMTEES